jgi:predicted Na+-dependent transporter
LFRLVVQVTLVAQGDVPLSIVMTVCSTLAAVFLTPLLTKILAGAYIPVDAVKRSLSTLQVKFLMPFVHNKSYSCFL